jgi:alkanesulfonate monooxygenase SsuD/methylene tetrahydromethanopterin reductase-like flavin-dependent oxidoreductase (luciferase family)
MGYGEIWLAEDYFELGGIASAATALAATESIPVGLGVVAAPVRHPAVAAMEFATLGGTYPGRFMAGLGHGAPDWVRQMGLSPDSPMRLLREATEAIRRLLNGAAITGSGDYFRFEDVSLDHPPSTEVPLYFGVQGPASLRLAGELADGTLLGWFTSPGSIRWARHRVDEGRERGRRSGSHKLATLCLLAISNDDPAAAGRSLAQWAGPILSRMVDTPPMMASAEGEELRALLHRVGKEDLGTSLPLNLLRRFAAAGTLDDCAGTVSSLLAAGSDRVILVPNPAGFRSTAEMLDQMALVRAIVA